MVKKVVIKKKLSYIIALLLLLFLIAGIPTLCNFLLQDNKEIVYWDGSIADGYHSGRGDVNDPYIISTPAEFAYFSKMISDGNSYEGKYFKLNSDIYINSGVFDLENGQPIYLKDYKKYYFKNKSNVYYSDIEFKNKVGEVNLFPVIKSFKGTLDGNNNNIYGIYLNGNSDKSGLFVNLEGNIRNLKIKNSLIVGNDAALITDTLDSVVSGLSFTGIIKANSERKIINKKIDDVIVENVLDKIVLDDVDLPRGYSNLTISMTGKYETSNINNTININGREYTDSSFKLDNISNKEILINNSAGDSIKLFDINYTITYDYGRASLIGNSKNTILEDSYSKGIIFSEGIASGLLGTANGSVTIKNSYSNVDLFAREVSGMVEYVNKATLNIEKSYVSSDFKAEKVMALINETDKDSTVTIKNSFTTGNCLATTVSNLIGGAFSNVYLEKVYSTIQNINVLENFVPTMIELGKLKDKLFITETLGFLEYTDENVSGIWIIDGKNLPYLNTDDVLGPNISIGFGDKSWNSYSNKVESIKNPGENKVKISYNDKDSAILKTEYYISNDYRDTPLDINLIDWKLYTGEDIYLKNSGNYTVYVKVTDVFFNVSYAHSDMIIYDNYKVKLVDPVTDSSLEEYNNQITSKSRVKYIYEREYFTTNNIYTEFDKYYLMGDLPSKTKIYLYDKKNNKFYYYKSLDNDSNLYSLGDFLELGKDTNTFFDNSIINYYDNGKFCENFEFIFDFSEAIIEDNYELSLKLGVLDSQKNILVSSSDTTLLLLKKIEDGTSSLAKVILDSNVDNYFSFIKGNSLELSINSKIEKKKFNEKNIFDSNIKDSKVNLLIRVLNSNKEVLESKEINKLMVSFNDDKYYFNKNGEILITDFQDFGTTSTLKIDSLGEASTLKNGTYYFEFSDSNKYVESNKIFLPIKVDNEKAIRNYDYKVEWDNIKVWNRKTIKEQDVLNDILYDGDLEEPNVRVSLYKKVNFDSFSQEYQEIDIKDYLKGILVDDYNHFKLRVGVNKLKLKFDVSKMSLGGYRLVYKLYDGDSYVSSEVKSFIIK